MKIAIIGSGPLALLAARHFNEIGAHTVLFQRSPLGGNLRLLHEHLPETEIVFNGKSKSIKNFFANELVELVNYVEGQGISRQGNVLRVHKRFLHPHETIPGKSRLHDLFRVIFSLNPKETILRQLEQNPEMFKQLGNEVIESLHRPVESFEDFDIVIEATGHGKKPCAMGASRELALNEHNLQNSGLIYYQNDIFSTLNLDGKKSIVLVGEGHESKYAFLRLGPWLQSSADHVVYWISFEQVDFGQDSFLNHQCQQLLKELDQQFENVKIEFEQKIRAWRDLEDHEKVKVPVPLEPRPQIIFHEGCDVTSVDRLLDREGVFATIESPDFRACAKNKEELKTIAADAICVARGVHACDVLGRNLGNDEPGYYLLSADDLDSGQALIKSIEENLMTYFKKA